MCCLCNDHNRPRRRPKKSSGTFMKTEPRKTVGPSRASRTPPRPARRSGNLTSAENEKRKKKKIKNTLVITILHIYIIILFFYYYNTRIYTVYVRYVAHTTIVYCIIVIILVLRACAFFYTHTRSYAPPPRDNFPSVHDRQTRRES